MSRRTVLLVSQLFPPTNAAGALRTGFYSRNLPEFGWTPIVVTSSHVPQSARIDPNMIRGLPDASKIVRVEDTAPEPTAGLVGRARALWTILREPEVHNLRRFGRRMSEAALRSAREHSVDAVLVSIGPEALLRIGRDIHQALGTPWLADFRDVSDIFKADNLLHRLRLARLKQREAVLTASAGGLVAATRGFAQHLERRLHRDVTTIENGFDEDVLSIRTPERQPKFTISYTGLIWDPAHRDPRPLFEAVDRLVRAGELDLETLRIQFFGSEADIVGDWKAGYLCKDQIEILEKVPYQDSLRKQREASILLHLSHGGDDSVLTGKVYDYLAARRPILSIPGNEPVRALLRDTCAGQSADNVSEIAALLRRWYAEWRATGTIATNTAPDSVMGYSRRSQARQLATLLDDLIAQG